MHQTFNRRTVVALAAGSALGLGTMPALAQQNFPSQTVKLISPFPAGSGPDVVARIVGEKMGATFKQPVVVDARPGANGFLAMGAGKTAAASGHDLLLADVGHLSVAPSLFKSLPYDPKGDYVPVGGLYRVSFYMVVANDSLHKTVKDLLAAAAANPDKMNYGHNSVGGPLHLGAAQIEAISNTKMTAVAYKDTAQLYTAVATGEVDWAIGSLASAGPLLKAGKLRLLAIAETARSSQQPNVPTFEEAGGGKPVSVRSWVAVLAPKGTSAANVDAINRALNDALRQPDVVEKLGGFGFVPFVAAPAQIGSLIDSDAVVYADLVKRIGVPVQ